MVIFKELNERIKKMDEKQHQDYLDARGITEEEYQEEKRQEKLRKEREFQDKLNKLGLTEEQYKKRQDRISTLEGCVGPIIVVGGPLLAFYLIMKFIETTAVGQFIGTLFATFYGIILLGIAVVILIGIIGVVSSMFENKGVGIIVGIIFVILLIVVLANLPEGCTRSTEGYDYDRSISMNY